MTEFKGRFQICAQSGALEICCGGGTNEVIFEWVESGYDAKFFVNQVYPELKANRIFVIDINRNEFTCKPVSWPGDYFLQYLAVEILIEELEELGEHEIATYVRNVALGK